MSTKILLIEDDPTCADTIQDYIYRELPDICITHYTALIDAVNDIESHPQYYYTLIILNLNLPDVQGIDRLYAADVRVNILAIANINSPTSYKEAIKCGIRTHILKGVDITTLAASVKELCGYGI